MRTGIGRMQTISLTVCLASLAGGLTFVVGASQDAGPMKRRISAVDFAWISGGWSLEREGDTLEEHWSEPSGTCLMGVFRWLKKDGTVRLVEVLSIVIEDDGVFFRFRHFSPDLTAWEEKNQPLSFKLTRLTGELAVFENAEGKPFQRYSFEKDGANGLVVTAGDTRFAYGRAD